LKTDSEHPIYIRNLLNTGMMYEQLSDQDYLENYKFSYQYYDEAIQLVNRSQYPDLVAEAFIRISDLQLKLQDYKKAIAHANIAL
jgi:hypothetical protein